ncbi:hypothetical protein JTE90_018710 [Oedothorax gibbosus]|uniref:Cytochrome P450 n=1 Tax=Oedothorax gibbosus TaxID=931172 RepID=A0AAV6TZJ6_9ARAC|nr:hypothetical protein JTE90_018710 [Oedothorax gibbosus]
MFGMDILTGPLATTLLIGLTTVILLYWYSIKSFDYWKKYNIPYVKPIPLLGNALDLFKKPLHEIEYERYFKYGPLYGYFEGSKPILSVADPAVLRDIFVKDFAAFPSRRILETGNEVVDKMMSVLKGGEEWKRIRAIVTPTFTTGKIKRMLSIFKDCSNTLVKNFRTAAAEGTAVDAKRLYGAFTMDIIASSAFSTKIDSHNDPENKFVAMAKKVFSQQLNWRMLLFFTCPWLLKLFKINPLPEDAVNFFKDATLQIMEERKRTGQVRNDFLQLLMDTAKEVEDDLKEEEPKGGDIASNYGGQEDINYHIFKSVTSKSLSINELVAQCVIFFIAGYDTTASTLSLASYFLALNPSVQEKVRAEVDEALKHTDGELTYESLKSMRYLDNVISETLRIYPPLSRLDRTADADYTFSSTGITIRKGNLISIPVHGIHRDPNIYPEPEKFDPDRFTPEEKEKRDPYVYLPFGAGPRNCVAMRFALIEVKVCLAHVIANFIIKRCPETKIPLEFGLGQGLIQPQGIILQMDIRKDSLLTK